MTVLFIPTASVNGDQPSEWLKQRLDAAVAYHTAHPDEVCPFVVAGRWNNVSDSFEFTEAEVAKRYILFKLPEAVVLKEDISVETGGGFAFGKPLVAFFKPDKVVIFNSEVNSERNKYLAGKIFAPTWQKEFVFINDSLSQNSRARAKEPKALQMFQNLFKDVSDGDDASVREILLYKTPFYFKGIIDDMAFFDVYWPGGYSDFLEKRLSINNQ
jgi:hypothetical protein